jgi:hypothetical protein
MLNPFDHVGDYVDDYLHEMLSAGDARNLEEHCIVCPQCQSALAEARKRMAGLQALPPREASERLIRKVVGNIDDYERRRRRVRRIFGWSTLVATAASVLILASLHFYYANLTPSPYDLAVLGQTKLFPGSAGSLCLRLVHQQTGAALAAVPVRIELRGKDRSQVVQLAKVETNAEGIAQPRFDVPDWADGDYQLHIVAQPEGKTEELVQPIRLQRSWKLMLSSDKPVYQPGQEIHLRGLALRRPDLKPVAGQQAIFTITDPKGNVIFKRQTQTSAYGITSADCLLATEVIEGPYTIACKMGDVGGTSDTESKLTVDVKKYVLPKFKIDVQGLDAYYQPGQTVKATVKAEYFFGGPVANGIVEIEINAPGFPIGRGPMRPPTITDPNVLQRLTLQTDAVGNAAFQVVLPKTLIGRPQDSGDARFFLQVKVRDAAGQEEKRTVSRFVTNQPLRVEAIPEGGILVPDVPNKIYIYVSYPDGRPAKARLRVPIDKEIVTNELGVTSFEVNPHLVPLNHPPGSFTWGVVFQTGPNAFVLDFLVKASDETGKQVQKEFRLPCGQAVPDFIVRPDKAVYQGGDTMKLTALGGGPSTVYVDLIKDGQTYLSETVDMKDGQGELQVDLPPELFGTVELCAYRFGPEGLPVRKTRAIYIKQARQLTIQTKPDKDEYRPGQNAKIQFRLLDAQGKPAPGALSLAAVDEAVFSVLEQAPGMERTFYTLEQEILKPVYAIYPWSPELPLPVPAEERNQFEQALFSRTAQTAPGTFATPPSTGQRGGRATKAMPVATNPVMTVQPQRQTSPHSLAVFSFTKKANEVAETRRAGLERVETGWILLAIAMAITGYTAFWIFVRLRWVLLAHCLAIPMGCVLISMIGILGTKASMEFSPVGFGGLVDSAMVKSAMPESAMLRVPKPAEAPGGPEVRVRQDFPETLLWRPELITDDQGRASLDLALADSITTWRLTASAVSADGRLGGAETPIRVFQPFFVDLNLPVALTRNDEVTIPVVVYNYLAKPQVVELTLADADWFERLDDTVKSLELKPKEVRSTSYRLRVKRVGNHHLQVTARGSELADAIKRVVEVVPDGQKVEQVVTDRLTGNIVQTVHIPEHAIPDSHKVLVKLYPGILSQVIEGVDGMLRQPFG